MITINYYNYYKVYNKIQCNNDNDDNDDNDDDNDNNIKMCLLIIVITCNYYDYYEFINNQFCLKILFKIFYFMNKNANNGVIKKTKSYLPINFCELYCVKIA